MASLWRDALAFQKCTHSLSTKHAHLLSAPDWSGILSLSLSLARIYIHTYLFAAKSRGRESFDVNHLLCVQCFCANERVAAAAKVIAAWLGVFFTLASCF